MEQSASSKPGTGQVDSDNGAVSGASSENTSALISQLRRQREEIGKTKQVTLPVPGYTRPELLVEYEKLEWDEVKKIAQKAEESQHPEKELMGQIDLIVRSAKRVLIRHNGETAPINTAFKELGEEPIKYDRRLAQALGIEATSARQVVREVFNNDLAVSDHHTQLWRWMSASNTEADQDF